MSDYPMCSHMGTATDVLAAGSGHYTGMLVTASGSTGGSLLPLGPAMATGAVLDGLGKIASVPGASNAVEGTCNLLIDHLELIIGTFPPSGEAERDTGGVPPGLPGQESIVVDGGGPLQTENDGNGGGSGGDGGEKGGASISEADVAEDADHIIENGASSSSDGEITNDGDESGGLDVNGSFNNNWAGGGGGFSGGGASGSWEGPGYEGPGYDGSGYDGSGYDGSGYDGSGSGGPGSGGSLIDERQNSGGSDQDESIDPFFGYDD